MLTLDTDKKITMFVGDTGEFTVDVTVNGENLLLATGDSVKFSVKEHIDDIVYALQKEITTFTNGKAIVKLLPADTILLTPNKVNNKIDKTFPNYVYDIELTDASGNVHTLMPEYKIGKFVLVKGVTNE